jgi:hypothetical protein
MLRYEEKLDQFFRHGIIAVNKKLEIIHFCGYPNPPTESDYIALEEELKTDEEFDIKEEFILLPCPEDLLPYYLKIMEEADENGTIRYGDE